MFYSLLLLDYYNNERLRSAVYYLRPVGCYEGNPVALVVERNRKLEAARQQREERRSNHTGEG